MTRALRRAVTSPTIFILAALLFLVGTVGGTYANFTGETQHQTSTFAGGWLDAPTGLGTPTINGNGAILSWSRGSHGVTGQDLYYTDRGTTANCTGAAYSSLATAGFSNLLQSTTDDRGQGASGHYICYQIRSTHGSWYTGANFSIIQVGLVPTGIAVTEGSGNAGQIGSGDYITLGFNQSVTYGGSSTITVCAYAAPDNVVTIGDTTGCTNASSTPAIGKITGLSIPNTTRSYTTSAAAASGSTVRIDISGTAHGANDRTAVTGTGTFTYTGSGTIVQSSNGGAGVCTAANCTWTYSGGF